MTLWEVITGNSTLPVGPGTTFYEHLLNQQAGGGGGGDVFLTGGIDVDTLLAEVETAVLLESMEVDTSQIETNVDFDDTSIDVDFDVEQMEIDI